MIHLAEAHAESQPATAEQKLSQRILQHLDGVPAETSNVLSRSLKELLGGLTVQVHEPDQSIWH